MHFRLFFGFPDREDFSEQLGVLSKVRKQDFDYHK